MKIVMKYMIFLSLILCLFEVQTMVSVNTFLNSISFNYEELTQYKNADIKY